MEPIPIKLVIVGDGAVGKTSILFSYSMNKFPKEYQPTVFDNYTTSIKIDGKIISLGLWDTAGQEQYAKLRPLAYSNTDIFLIAFSVVDKGSFTNALKKWYPEVSAACPNAVISFVGNKVDLREGAFDKSGSVQADDAIKAISQKNCIYRECSALTRQGLIEVFEKAVREVIKTKSAIPQQTKKQVSCCNCQ